MTNYEARGVFGGFADRKFLPIQPFLAYVLGFVMIHAQGGKWIKKRKKLYVQLEKVCIIVDIFQLVEKTDWELISNYCYRIITYGKIGTDIPPSFIEWYS